ncbi:hypothetical protein AMAG_11520 [Allomyces macrogynus ATCC 38327]|uniref:CDT1 Geminin-binding domain-containing protein n=1 Tax=Allomyces macrogynus (strain ATCC 38327) TaxID=578462 RepID=A0A0L0SV77_ALLM3|nr:hypothetical protein AMAG_11520 [Allomyces macrogynus ATCC 38327]|eukprot:KNE66376.1 hypothetical protein AMAG_11520 [Allomyces macrogynus ATCC 38327]
MSAPNPPKPQQTLLSSYLTVVKRTTRSAAKANAAKANIDTTSTTAPTIQHHSPPNSPKDTRAAKRMRLGPQNLPTSEPDVQSPVRSSARLAARAQNLSVVTDQKRARRTPIKLALPHEPATVASPIRLALPEEEEPVVEKDVPARPPTPEAPAAPAKSKNGSTPATNRIERALQILDSPSKPTSARGGTTTPPVSAGLLSPRAASVAGVLSPTAASPSKPKTSLKDRFARLAERAPRRNLITAFESALPDKPAVPPVPRTPTSAGTPTVPATPTTTTDLTSPPTSATSRPSISTAPTPRARPALPTSPTPIDPYRLPHLDDINPSSTPLPTGSATRRPRLAPAGQPHVIAPTQRVPLSPAMTHLDQVFNGLEFSVAYQRGRGELCTFQSVQRNVENASSRAFTLTHVAMIRGVFPEAYDLQPVKADWHGNKVETVAFDFNVSWARKRRADDDEDSEEEREVVSKPEFLAVDIPKRRIEFRARLIALVERAHRAFLVARDLHDWEPTDPLRPWHPEFDLKTVAIPVMALPTLRPITPRKLVQLPTAAAVRAAKTKAQVVAAMDLSDSDDSGVESGRRSPTPSSPKRPGVQQRFSKLLERVRAKEEQVKRDVLLGMSPEEVREKTMLSRLPLMAETVQIQLAQLGKNVAPLATLAQKVVDSYPTPMSVQMATEHLHLLAKTVPAWCNVVEIGVKKFVRVVPANQASVKPTIAQAQQAIAAKFANSGAGEDDEEAGSSTAAAVAATVGSGAAAAVWPVARGGGTSFPTRVSTATRGGGGAALLDVRKPATGGLAARQTLLHSRKK